LQTLRRDGSKSGTSAADLTDGAEIYNRQVRNST
jgi:hypothetical protein